MSKKKTKIVNPIAYVLRQFRNKKISSTKKYNRKRDKISRQYVNDEMYNKHSIEEQY